MILRILVLAAAVLYAGCRQSTSMPSPAADAASVAGRVSSAASTRLALGGPAPVAAAGMAPQLQLMAASRQSLLREIGSIPLPGVEGRIDHLAWDPAGQRLFVAALGNNTVEVLDVRSGRHVHTITGLDHPQGIAVSPESGALYVANDGGGVCDIFDAQSYRRIKQLTFGDDADNVRHDPAARRIYVGYGSGAIGIIDTGAGRRIGDIPLPAHPESFQLEKTGSRIYVNVPGADRIAVIDRKQQRVIANWRLEGARANFPMALDEANHRLFIGCRDPARLLVFDTQSGQQVNNLEIDGDTDDLFYDSAARCLYVSCGEGFLDVIEQRDPDHYGTLSRLSTAPGARTSLFVPELRRLYLAVPHRGRQPASVRIFSVESR